MNSSDLMLKLLPAGRSYARALSGSQEAGDDLVAAVLEWSPFCDVRWTPPGLKLEFFQQLTDAWADLFADLPALDGAACSGKPADGTTRMGQLSSVRRQAYLLVTIASFSVDEAALVLRRSVDDVARELSMAQAEIAALPAVKVMIIEDEFFIATHLEEIVSELGHCVVGIATTRTEAVALFRAEQPDLILADVHLADRSSGIEAVSEIVREQPLPIIFITAYPELLLTGLKPEPAFLIAKPFRAEQVRASISQALFFTPLAIPALAPVDQTMPGSLRRSVFN